MTAASPEAPASPHTPLARNVKVLGGASLLNDVASEASFPLLPGFLLTTLGGSPFSLAVIEGVADTAAGLLKLWSGGRSDRAGRRKEFVLFGYAPAALARPLIGLAAAPWQLFALRVADRLGKGVRTAPRDALIADSTAPAARGRAFGFHRAMDHLGAALGPLLATAFLWLWTGQVRALFLATLFPGLLAIGLLAIGLREPPAAGAPRQAARLTLRPFGRDFRLFLLALAVFTLGNSTDAFLLVRAEELGVPAVLLPLLWCVFHVAKSAANFVLGRVVDRSGPRPLLFAGWLLYAGVYAGFAVAAAAWQAWSLFLAYALFYGLTEPAEKALAAELGGAGRTGLAFGWYNFAVGVGALPASLLCGALYQAFGPAAAFGLGAVLALAAAAVLAAVPGQPEPGAPTG